MRSTEAYEDAARQTWRHASAAPAGREALQRELIRYATLAPNSHNVQPWRFRLRDDGIDVLPDMGRRTPVVDPDDHHLWVSLGCAVENIVLAGAAFGLHADMAVTEAGVRLQLHASADHRSPLFECIPQRQTTRDDYDGRPLATAELQQLEDAAADAGVELMLLTGRAAIDRVRDVVIAANSAQMADPAYIAELRSWIRYNERDALAVRDGLFAGCSGSPSLPAWLGPSALKLVFRAPSENRKYARHIDSSAGIAIIAAIRPSIAGWVDAGRACQRFLLQATALDVRTAFVNQPVEVANIRDELAAAAGLRQRRPDLVIRFGRGARMPRSLRRPITNVIAA